eukprot:1597961-Pyramimonas_sp.AAC.1
MAIFGLFCSGPSSSAADPLECAPITCSAACRPSSRALSRWACLPSRDKLATEAGKVSTKLSTFMESPSSVSLASTTMPSKLSPFGFTLPSLPHER